MQNRMMTVDPRCLLKRFYDLQGERVQTYTLFEEGFQAYLKGAPNYNFEMYRQLVHEITETFKKISQDVISIKNSIANDCHLNQIADILDQIQEEEKVKLEVTANLQIARKNHTDHPTDEQHRVEIEDLRKRLHERMEKINEYLEDLRYESEDLYSTSDDDDT